jgi:TonB family protein
MISTLLTLLVLGTPDAGAPALTPESIREVVHQHRPEVRRCSEAAIARRRDLTGKLVVHFVISAQGTVSSASAKESTTGDEKLTACVLSSVKGWVFAHPKNPPVEINFPFHFGAASSSPPPKVKLPPGEPELVE